MSVHSPEIYQPIYPTFNFQKVNLAPLLVTLGIVLALPRLQARQDLANPLVTSQLNTFTPSFARSSARPSSAQTQANPALIGITNPLTLATERAYGNVQPTTTPPTLQPQKFLKFTLTAGKFWKFNIKTNSFQTSHKEKELRLHRNLSSNNFIIDDDGWFQYNHNQQQLFAWPSYSIKESTYYFVLLPSGLDYEADGENIIKSGDIVANIVVELISPYVNSRLDIDQLIDHKFSLDYLHRHSSYPLLLTQIVSIFNTLARRDDAAVASSLMQPTYLASTTPVTTTSVTGTSAASIQSKQQRSNRLGDFLLIDSSSTPDGEYFSITWTTHASIANNTIQPITECRLALINETVSKLSSRSTLYPFVDDKSVISYSLEGPLVNSQAIIPTERGNYALKLTLIGPCRRTKIFEELGITAASGVYISFPDEEKEASVIEKQNLLSSTPKSSTRVVPASNVNTTSATKNGEEVDSSDPILSITENSKQQEVLENTASSSIEGTLLHVTELPLSDKQHPSDITTTNPVTSRVTASISTGTALGEAATSGHSPVIELSSTEPEVQTLTNTRRALATPASQNPPNQQLQQPKLQPQAKSFINFLDSPESKSISEMNVKEVAANPNFTLSTETTTYFPATTAITNSSTSVFVKSGPEPSLNDDLIGILNDITEFLVSIAVPLSVILGIILIASILVATCNLCMKRRKAKQYDVGDRFKFRYGSERRGFLKNSSKPVILEADQKSLSISGTPQRKPTLKPNAKSQPKTKQNEKDKKDTLLTRGTGGGSNFFSMSVFHSSADGGYSGGHLGGADCGGGGACDGGDAGC